MVSDTARSINSYAPPPLLYVNGKWKHAASGQIFDDVNPSTGETIAQVACAGAEDATEALESARDAFKEWRRASVDERAGVLLRMHQVLLDHKEELARLRTLEQGAPLEQGRSEVEYAAGFYRWFGEEARRIYGRTIPHPDPGRRLRVEYFPAGVACGISPWNLPLSQPSKKVAAAIAAGCTIVLKPSELTPLCGLALAKASEEAGLPPGVLNVICGDAQGIGNAMLEHPDVRMISFTGSVPVGKYLASEALKHMKRVAMELGGSAPFLVFEDADLDRAARDLIWLKLSNAGQVCVTANRVLVQSSIAKDFTLRLESLLSEQVLGSGLDPGTTVGPLITPQAVEKVRALVADALAGGAHLRFQTAPVSGAGCFCPPTLLIGVTPEMRIAQEEVFGPVLSVIEFGSEEDGIALANATPYGLASYAYTSNMARAQRLADSLEAGVVGINDPRPIIPEAPFGGVKQSGLGHEGGREGLLEYLEERLIGVRYP